MNEDLRQLRGKIDGDDQFFQGHQILKIRKREKIIPEWSLNDQTLKKLLLQVFPNWKTNKRQHKRAARWVWVIHLYYRLGMPHNQVAEETSIDYDALRSLLRNIRRAANGLQANNGKPRGLRKPGRPKKLMPHLRYPT